ncbi:MAG TPA: signal peptidase I [Candidatus Limnocylindria bacterium]
MRTLGRICSLLLAVALFGLCLGVVALRVLGMGTFVVTGGSMEPTIAKGSLVIVEPVAPATIARGDIITFEHYGQVTTHRVIAIAATAAEPTFTTKGDANAAPDPEPVHFTGQVGIYRAAIPFVGYAVAYAQAYWRLALTAIAGAAFLGCAAALIFGNAKPRRPRRRITTIDPEEVWASHMGWLREANARRTVAA